MGRFEGLPVPGLQARAALPIARRFANAVGATADRVRQDLAELPAKLDHVDALLADGTLSLEQPSAAAFQIGTSVRALHLFPQLDALVADRPRGELGRTLLPDYPQSPPAQLPPAWVPSASS
jgi:glutathione S-transferase